MGSVLLMLFAIYPLLGLYQFISALLNYFSNNLSNQKYKKRLAKYLIGVIIYFLILVVLLNVLDFERGMNEYEGFMVVYLFVVPWILAVYFWRIKFLYLKEEESAQKDTLVG